MKLTCKYCENKIDVVNPYVSEIHLDYDLKDNLDVDYILNGRIKFICPECGTVETISDVGFILDQEELKTKFCNLIKYLDYDKYLEDKE